MRLNKGSYLLGIIGAFLGAVLASIPFIIAYKLGYIVFIFAILFMTLSALGYNKLGGRVSYLKIFIVGFFGFTAAILSIFSFDIYDLYLFAQETPDYSITDIPSTIIYALQVDAEYRASILGNMVLPLILTFIGWIYVIIETVREVNAFKQMQAHNEMVMQQQAMYGDYNQTAYTGGMNQTSGQAFHPEQSAPQDSFSAQPNQAYTGAGVNEVEENPYREEDSARRPEE